MSLALSCDAVVVLGGEELQQPLLWYLIGVLVGERLEPALGAPAADGAGGVAGNAGDLVGVQHVGLAGQQVLVPAAHTPAGGVGEEERAVQAEGWGLVVRGVLVPAAGRGVVRRLGEADGAGRRPRPLWRSCSSGSACRCSRRAPARSAADTARCGCRCGRLCGSRCGPWGRDRAPAGPEFAAPGRPEKDSFSSFFRFSFVLNLDPENHRVFHQNYTNC